MHPSGAVPHMLALLGIAAAALEAGQTIAAMVPTLRAAMHAVPDHERSNAMLLPMEVMDVLTADVAAIVAKFDSADEGLATGEPMSDDEAEEMGRFWDRVSAGEIRATCWPVLHCKRAQAPMLYLPEHGPKGFSPANVPGFFLWGVQGTPERVCKRVNSAAMPG